MQIQSYKVHLKKVVVLGLATERAIAICSAESYSVQLT